MELENGLIRALTWDEEGLVVTLGFWGAGDIVGQPLSQVRPYQLECLTKVRARELPLERGLTLEAMLLHARQTEALLSIVHRPSVPQRLLRLLRWLAQRFGREVAQGWALQLPLTHQEIAEAIGTSRVTVTRLLNQLEREGKLQRWSSTDGRRSRHLIILL